MIEKLESKSDNVVGFKISGKLHHDDYQTMVPAFDAVIEKAGKVRVLCWFDDFHGWDMHAMWDDTVLATTHCGKIERIAIVGDKSWEKWMATFCKPFQPLSKIKHFDSAELDAAWSWLDEE
ncbi:MAG: STAS/SEC14 domain-containing protein [Mariniblastus sp.]|jgi:hypothetical protein|nr:STAS/SEC14 domain-containing protein [Mariniblastus sp.]